MKAHDTLAHLRALQYESFEKNRPVARTVSHRRDDKAGGKL
jgi:hypothetical protein